MSGANFQTSKHDPCRGRAPGAALGCVHAIVGILGILGILALSPLVSRSWAEELKNPELPRPEENPLLIQPSPIGDIEYRPGRGLKIGDTGFTLGGFSTITASRLEGDKGRFRFDALDLFAFFDPTPYLHIFSDYAFLRLLDFDQAGDDNTSTADTSVERLYADLNLSDQVNFRLGKFLTPVGRWNQVPAAPLVWTTSRPLVTQEPFDEKTTGGAFSGSVFPSGGSITYTLYGKFFPALDPDSRKPPAEKSAGARLDFAALEGWSIGASYLSFSRHDNWHHLGGMDALWRSDRFEVSGEFLTGRGDPNGRRIFGLYVQGVAELASHVYAVGRYEHFDPGTHQPALDLFDAGLAWRPISFLILKADYLFATLDTEEANPGIRSSLSLLF